MEDSRAVTIVAHDIGPLGGMERRLTRLVSGLLARGYRVNVIARRCDLPPHPMLTWRRVRCPARPFTIFYPLFFVVGSFAVKRHAQGVVHTTGAIVFSRADVSTVHFCHHAFRNSEPVRRSSKRGPLYRVNARMAAALSLAGERWCYRPGHTETLVAVSDGVRRELDLNFRRMTGRIEVIPNGVDRDLFRPCQEEGKRLREELGTGSGDLISLFVGGEWERKGLRLVIQALVHAPEWHLLVVGPGDTPTFRRLAEERGVADRVHFAGRRSDTPRFFAAADAFVLPTEYEAFPLVVLEAASTGVPLVVTRVNGVEDLLTDGQNGWFITRDAKVIAERLRRLAADSERRAQMAIASREASAEYSWESVVERYSRLYVRIASD